MSETPVAATPFFHLLLSNSGKSVPGGEFECWRGTALFFTAAVVTG